nr:hypothetical protein [Bosea sp. LC85]
MIETPIARTQSGGLHLYFAWPDEPTLIQIAAKLGRMGQGFEGVIGNRAICSVPF